MRVYQFTLILSDLDDEIADAIYGKCRDSSTGRANGAAYVAFDREAVSLESAIASAVADLRSVGVEPLRIQMEVPVASS